VRLGKTWPSEDNDVDGPAAVDPANDLVPPHHDGKFVEKHIRRTVQSTDFQNVGVSVPGSRVSVLVNNRPSKIGQDELLIAAQRTEVGVVGDEEVVEPRTDELVHPPKLQLVVATDVKDGTGGFGSVVFGLGGFGLENGRAFFGSGFSRRENVFQVENVFEENPASFQHPGPYIKKGKKC
jgi:hypothetical protein